MNQEVYHNVVDRVIIRFKLDDDSAYRITNFMMTVVLEDELELMRLLFKNYKACMRYKDGERRFKAYLTEMQEVLNENRTSYGGKDVSVGK